MQSGEARLRRSGQSNRPWWLNRAALVSLIGLGLSALFALALSWLIPRQVAEEFLVAQASADQATLDFLISSSALPARGALNFEELDRFVRQAILRGDFVRAKLWSTDGTILYSDAPELIGRHFVPSQDFSTLRAPKSEVSDLDEPENFLEADQYRGRLLETYVPVLDGDDVMAVWEIYRRLDAYSDSVATTQRLVRLGVGSGLAILGVFLVSSFGLMVRTATDQRNQAEARSRDLERLLEVAKTTTEAEDPETMSQLLQALLVAAPEIEAASVIVTTSSGEERVLVDVKPRHAPVDRSTSRAVEVESTTTSGSTRVWILPSAQWDSFPTLHAMAEEISVGMQKALLTEGLNVYREQLEKVMDQMVVAEEGERRRLAGEIHDSLAQDLYRLLYGLRTLSACVPQLRSDFERMEEVVLAASRSLRHVLRNLHPTVVEDVGLAAAMRSLAAGIEEEYDVRVQLDLSSCPEPPNEIKLAIYRIAQEALVNVAKHSDEKRAHLRVSFDEERVVVTVHNRHSGTGAKLIPGMGMWLMKERAEHLGGSIEFAISDSDLTVHAEIPRGARV